MSRSAMLKTAYTFHLMPTDGATCTGAARICKPVTKAKSFKPDDGYNFLPIIKTSELQQRTQFPGSFNINIIDAGADAHNNPERLELLQVLLGEYNRMPHERPDCFVEHLLVYLTGGLRVAERNRGDILQDRHLDGAVSPVEQRHQRSEMYIIIIITLLLFIEGLFKANCNQLSKYDNNLIADKLIRKGLFYVVYGRTVACHM